MSTALIDKKLRYYRILRKLGDGGMGTVYLARVVKARRSLPVGAEVALKVLHPHLAESRDVLKRFQREAGLGLTIRHPRIVTVYDVGSEKLGPVTIHFLVMEYLAGKTLRKALDDAGTFPEARVIEIGRQLAEGLAEIHRHGIIHRDIKPSNIFLDGDEVKLADLGLSRLVEPRTEISLPGTVLGSVAYAAPEQMEGKTATTAADIYSLGVLMYELASGTNPFLREDFNATVKAHATANAPALGRLVKVSYFLERVIAAMLLKEPSDRLGPASRLERILESRERSDFWRDFTSGEEPAARLSPARSWLRVRRATRLHGRDDELERLVDVLRTAGVGRTGGLALVSGESGIGRTRLVDATLEAAELEGIPVRALMSRFLDQATPVPYFPLNAILLDAFDLTRLDRAARREALPDLLRSHLPERAVFAEGFADLIVGRESTDLSRLPPRAIPALYAEVLRTLAARHALCLVIEELQWADRGSLRVLKTLLPSLRAFPIAVIGTVRDVMLEPVAEASVYEPGSASGLLTELSRRPEVGPTIELHRLERGSVLEILHDLAVPDGTAGPLAARLYQLSEGNPMFLFALIDELEQRDQLRDARGEGHDQARLPTSIRELLQQRLDEIDPQARRFVDFASVFGTRFKLDDVVAGLGLDLMSASEIVARLRNQRVLRVADNAYRFDHHMMKECLYRAMPEDQRRADNRTVARILKRKIADPAAPTQETYEAAIHFSLGGDNDEAARHLVGAIRYLTGRSLYERALRFARQAKAHVEKAKTLSASERFGVYEALAAVAGHLGKRDEQIEALTAAWRIAHDAGDLRREVEAEILLARHAGSTGLVFCALDHATRARGDAERGGFQDLQAAAIRVESTVLGLLGQFDHEDALKQADELATAAGDALGRAHGRMQLGRLYLASDRPSQALDTLKSALADFDELRDERGRGRAYFQIARVYREFGDLVRAAKSLDFAERIARSNHDRGLVARCTYLRGDLAMRRRDLARAERLLHRALQAQTTAPDPTYQLYTLAALSLLYTSSRFEARDPRRAIEFAKRAARVGNALQVPRLSAYAYAVLAVAYLAAGRASFALPVSQKGIRYLEREDPGRKRASELLFVHYRCLKAVGRLDEARDYLRRARDLVLERAQEIEKEEMRRSFKENDRFNAVVLEEADAQLR